MYYTTGLHHDEIVDICSRITAEGYAVDKTLGRPYVLGLYKSVVVALAYLRGNRIQWELAEQFGVSQSTISRTITRFVAVIGNVVGQVRETVQKRRFTEQLIVDGTLMPCWSWKALPENYSGKHHTTGSNVQVACDLNGHLVWVSEPLPGATHDAKAIRDSGLFTSDPKETVPSVTHIADKGYVGLGILTPTKKQPGKNLDESDKQFNKEIHKIRYQIEQTIAHIKNWNILHTDYRRPYATFTETLNTIINLEFYRKGF